MCTIHSADSEQKLLNLSGHSLTPPRAVKEAIEIQSFAVLKFNECIKDLNLGGEVNMAMLIFWLTLVLK